MAGVGRKDEGGRRKDEGGRIEVIKQTGFASSNKNPL
jgi:hypothetical protein